MESNIKINVRSLHSSFSCSVSLLYNDILEDL